MVEFGRGLKSQLAAILDLDFLGGLSRLRPNCFHLVDDVHSFDNRSEHDMFTIQPCCLFSTDEELRSICVLASISHRQNSSSCVLQREILILELVSVDALSTGSVVFGEVSALAHEFRDDAMERAVLVSKALLTSAQGTEVLSSLWNDIRAKLHDDFSCKISTDVDVEENPRQGHLAKMSGEEE